MVITEAVSTTSSLELYSVIVSVKVLSLLEKTGSISTAAPSILSSKLSLTYARPAEIVSIAL
jgi:hypothetical protein